MPNKILRRPTITDKKYLKEIHLYSTHRREGQIFRGASRYRKKVWRDWALFDWGTDGHLPGKIWGFTNLQGLPATSRLQYGGIHLRPGIYAIIENSYFVEDEEEKELSELFVPILKEKEDVNAEGVAKFKFYLADVESILQPLTVIPDLEGKPNAYFLIKIGVLGWKTLKGFWKGQLICKKKSVVMTIPVIVAIN